ncbi:MAG: hypothetical protein MSK40_16495 [Parabacteroides sp.]|nr:hypothetical protein [Parabacteroides sp.]
MERFIIRVPRFRAGHAGRTGYTRYGHLLEPDKKPLRHKDREVRKISS